MRSNNFLSKKYRESNNLAQNLFNPKTINAKYVQNVTRSEVFLADFRDYLEKEFIKDYSKTIDFKIGKVIEKCNDLISKKRNGIANVKDYVEQNPKCKLPWTHRELDAARISVRDLIDNKLKIGQV